MENDKKETNYFWVFGVIILVAFLGGFLTKSFKIAKGLK